MGNGRVLPVLAVEISIYWSMKTVLSFKYRIIFSAR